MHNFRWVLGWSSFALLVALFFTSLILDLESNYVKLDNLVNLQEVDKSSSRVRLSPEEGEEEEERVPDPINQ